MNPGPINLLISHAGNLVRAGICVFLAWGLLYQGDLLGLGPATDRQSSQLVELGVGTLRPELYPSRARANLLVVTADDLSLAAADEVYPPSHHFHAQVLRQILLQQPKAVLVDVILDICREGTDELVDALDLAGRLGIAVYVAAARPSQAAAMAADAPPACVDATDVGRPWPGRAAYGLLPEIARRAVPVDVLRRVGASDADDYCLVPAPDRSDLCVKLSDLAGLPSDLGGVRLSAAFRIYHDLCMSGRWAACGPVADAPPVEWPPRAASMDVMWGYGAAEAVDAAEKRSDDCGSDARPLRESLAAFLWEGVDWLRSPCPYTSSMSAMPLLAEGSGIRLGAPLAAIAPGSEQEQPQARAGQDPLAAIRDKVVLYGFDLAGSADVIRPSTHIALPGVFLHAMALDNLLTWGEHYKAPAIWFAGYRMPGFAINFSTFLVIFVLCYLARSWAKERFSAVAVLLRVMASPLNLLALCLLLGGVFWVYFDLAPINWLAIVGFAAVVPSVIGSTIAMTTRLGRAAVPLAVRLRRCLDRFSSFVRDGWMWVVSRVGRMACGSLPERFWWWLSRRSRRARAGRTATLSGS